MARPEGFKHGGLEWFVNKGDARRFHPARMARIGQILEAPDRPIPLEVQLRPGHWLHPLKGGLKVAGLWACPVTGGLSSLWGAAAYSTLTWWIATSEAIKSET